MTFTKGTLADVAAVLDILNQSVLYFKENKIDQWQDGYPNEAVVMKDIQLGQCYLLILDNRVRGVMTVMTTPDPNYSHLDNGQWRYDEPYGTIHRIAINKDFPSEGLSQKMLSEAERIAQEAGCQVMRIDTHKDNLGMKHILMKQGYEVIGDLTLPDGGKRLALDKKL